MSGLRWFGHLSLGILVVVCEASCSRFTSHQFNSEDGSLRLGPKNARKELVSPGYFESFGKKYMVVSEGGAATQAGMAVLESGGNIFDAAVAISFAISVERPHSTGIGGGGFMLIKRRAHPVETLDFREKAPQRAFERMFLDDHSGEVIPSLSLDGVLSVGVPGMVAGLVELHSRFGRVSFAKLVEPAIELAEKGFKVYSELEEALSDRAKILKQHPDSKKIFLKSDGSPLKIGELLIQKDLAKTLRTIAKNGRKGFYGGWVAQAILHTVKVEKGILNASDLENYQFKYRDPVYGTYKGYEIYSMPPPSSGGTHIIEILNILENDNLRRMGVQSPKSIHLISAATQKAFSDRAHFMGDPDFVNVPTAELISKKYAREIRKSIPENKAVPSPEIFPKLSQIFSGGQNGHLVMSSSEESFSTTHFTIQDAEGNIISSTQTINGWFGSGVVAMGTGIVLNNEMDDFSAKPGSSNLFGAIGGLPNKIQSGKRPLSSMSPTMVFRNGLPILALGSPGGTRIISCVLQTLLNYLEFGLPLVESVLAVRFHHQWQPDEIRIEPPGFSYTTHSKLTEMGHKLNIKNVNCRVNAISKEGEILHGVVDPRGEGLAFGE